MKYLIGFYLCVLICFVSAELGGEPPYTPYYYYYQDPNDQTQYLVFNGLVLRCAEHLPLLEVIPTFNMSENVNGMSIYNCMPPPNSYADVFDTLNIKIDNLTELSLQFDEKEPLPPGNYTEGLQLSKLVITKEPGSYRDIFRKARDFFEPLVNVKAMDIYNIQIPAIPGSMQLKNLSLGGDASMDEWGNCRFLEKMSFSGLSSERIPIWPADCKNVSDLKIEYISERVEQYLSNLTAVAPNLVNLKVSYSNLYTLPHDLLQNSEKLQRLDLSYNNIYDYALANLPVMTSIRELDLSGNLLKGAGLKYLVPRFPALRRLKIEHTKSDYFGFCNDLEYRTGLNLLFASSVKDLSFLYTPLDISCFKNAHFSNLTFLNFGGAISRVFSLRDLPTTSAPNLTIDFNFTHLIAIEFNETDYKIYQELNSSLTRPNKLIAKIQFVRCDCSHGWLARALRDFPDQLSMPKLRCDTLNGIEILKQDPDKLECDKWRPDNCAYRRRWGQTDVDAECAKGYLPTMNYTVRGLNISSHDLVAFYTNIPSSVTWLDYRNNRLSTASAQDVNTLFVNGRRVWLGNNQIICDCDNRILLDAIQEHRDQVQDFDNLTCIGTGQKISEVDTYVLCQTGLKITFIALGVLAFIAIVVAFIIRRYNEEIRMYLFARGWCLVCIRQEDFDDKPFDAFVSFAHEDEKYIKETLIPGLENAAEQYRVCVHYRDWVIGDWIPAQIMRSVKLSKRTIIVLSKSFIESTWSALEFRFAVANSKDSNSRVLILVLDDVLSEELDPELQGYLSYNTYLSCDDPWFWEKLRYAMPHRNDKNKKKSEDAVTPNAFSETDNSINDIIVRYSEHNIPLNNVAVSVAN